MSSREGWDLDGVGVFVDDLAVSGKDDSDHDKNLINVVKRDLERNIRFNLAKSFFKTTAFLFLAI